MSRREKTILAVSWLILVLIFLHGTIGGRWLALSPFRSKVCIRLDDVQDHWMWEGQVLLMDYCISKRVGMTLGVVSGTIGDDPRIVDRVQYGVNLGLFEVALHGWRNENYSRMDYAQQLDLIQRGKGRLENIFPGTTIVTFIPPTMEFNNDTIRACEDAGFRFISANIRNYSPESDSSVRQFPETVETAEYDARSEGSAWIPHSAASIIESIKNSLEEYSYAVVTIHAQQLYEWIGNSPVGVNGDLFSNIARVVDWIAENLSPTQIRRLGDTSLFGIGIPPILYSAVGLVVAGIAVFFYRRRRTDPRLASRSVSATTMPKSGIRSEYDAIALSQWLGAA